MCHTLASLSSVPTCHTAQSGNKIESQDSDQSSYTGYRQQNSTHVYSRLQNYVP